MCHCYERVVWGKSYAVGDGTSPTVSAAMRDDVVAGGNMRLFAQSKCQILTGDSDPQISTCRGGPGPLSNTMLLGTTLVSLPNGISFRPSVIAGFMSLRWHTVLSVHTDIHTDRRTDEPRAVTSVVKGRIADAFSDTAYSLRCCHPSKTVPRVQG